MKILVRATNWVGDAVMSLPALHALRNAYPKAHIAIHARSWVADIYARESFCDQIIRHEPLGGWRDFSAKLQLARELRRQRFDMAILLQNAFEAAVIAQLAGIPRRIGYNRDGRGLLLTEAVTTPKEGDTPPHERFYYLELLKRARIIESYSPDTPIFLGGREAAKAAGEQILAARSVEVPLVGVSPGAAYGSAKRWLPSRFAESAARLADHLHGGVALFGSASELPVCQEIEAQLATTGVPCWNFAGQTSLKEFIELAANCRVFLSNDSGPMHIASALGIPLVTVFGATNPVTTGPASPSARVVRELVECAPCLLRECPIDHRCMTRVSADHVVATAMELIQVRN